MKYFSLNREIKIHVAAQNFHDTIAGQNFFLLFFMQIPINHLNFLSALYDSQKQLTNYGTNKGYLSYKLMNFEVSKSSVL